MGNIIFGSVLMVMYVGIIHSIFKQLMTKGTVCTSCKVCPIKSKEGLLEMIKDMEKPI